MIPLLAVTAVVWGCTDASPVAGDEPAKRSIAVIPKGTSHEFWKSIHAGAVKASRDLDVEIIWKGPAREDDRDDQIKVVEQFITRGVDGIVIAPLDDTALVRPLKAAVADGIPVVVIDSGLNWDGYVSFAATDNFHGGELAADELGKKLGGRGKVIMLRYVEGSASTSKREEGFIDRIQSSFPDIEILSDNQYGGATLEGCISASENLLDRFVEIDGIFAPCEPVTVAFMRTLDQSGRKAKTVLVGFDASEALVTGLKNGQVDGLVVQSPFAMGEQGVNLLVQTLNGEEIPKRVDTGCVVITAANMDEPSNKDLLDPPLAKYLD
jgi:ribose transport system substrate-binding protein